MKTFDLFWSPEGRKIATVDAETGWHARRMAPMPYRRYIGEIYSVAVTADDGKTAPTVQDIADALADAPIALCIYCETPLPDDTHAPYCSAHCAIDADVERRR